MRQFSLQKVSKLNFMARPARNSAVDYSTAHNLTNGLLERARCPQDAKEVLLKDAEKPGLRLRVTHAGKHWSFEARINGKLLKRSLGAWPAISLAEAREEAHRLRGMAERGIDPREAERAQAEHHAAQSALIATQTALVSEAWAAYIAERSNHWGALHLRDHKRLASAGGEASNRGTRGRGVTIAGPLFPLMSYQLRDLKPHVIDAWAEKEAQTRPTAARLAWRLLKAFLAWCAEHPSYSAVVHPQNPAKTRKAREALGKATAKQDALLKEQLRSWFEAVRAISNPAISAYLQALLLTGARPGEVLALRWEDINLQWRGLTIRDKVEGERTVPLTPYLHSLLNSLPRRTPWVFAGFDANGNPQPMSKPHQTHTRACAAAGIVGLTLHGLRRSFGTLSEWLELPAGVVAQIQGHKPSATAEKHYRVRPLDLLRVHHERLEAWILEQAKIPFNNKEIPPLSSSI